MSLGGQSNDCNVSHLSELWTELKEEPCIVDLITTLTEAAAKDEEVHLTSTALLCELKQQTEKCYAQTATQIVRDSPEILSLLQKARALEENFKFTENVLLEFQKKIGSVTKKIRNYQEAAKTLEDSQQVKTQIRDLLSSYIQQTLVTPELVKHICETPITESYLEQFAALQKKLERTSQPGVLELPSARDSAPELQKLRTRAIQRVRDYIVTRIDTLRLPETDVQVVHCDLVENYLLFYNFLKEQHPVSANSIRQQYIALIETIYFSKFRAYVQALSRLPLHNAPYDSKYIGDVRNSGSSRLHSTARDAVSALLNFSRPQDTCTRSLPCEALNFGYVLLVKVMFPTLFLFLKNRS